MISLIHPSKGRAEMAYKTITNWLSKADDLSNVEYLLVLDSLNDAADYQKTIHAGCTTLIANSKTAIEAITYGAKQCNGDLIIVVSDDFDCPAHWDSLLVEALKDKSDFIVKTKDGIQKTLITLPIMDRVYYERFGYVYNPGYLHMFCDQEMTAVGEMTGKVVNVDIEFKHLHYTTGAMKKDAINNKNNATWTQGERLFAHRLKSNFGVYFTEIVKPYSEIVWH